MSYSDWIQSQKSSRVWLEESMKAIVQFAFIAPIHRVKHWNQSSLLMAYTMRTVTIVVEVLLKYLTYQSP